jgi:hypothetical protein
MINITYIYLVENCFDNPNKVYIGKTKNKYKRKSIHKKTYGKNIDYTIIDQIDSLNHKDWKPIETMWIQSFISWGFDVQNIKKEGGSGSSEWTKEQKYKQKQIFKNRNITWKTPGSKGYKWTEEQKSNRKGKGIGPNPLISLKKKNHPSRSKPVLQYDLKGNFIKEWKSCAEAGRVLFNGKSQCIQDCAAGRQKIGYKFIWKYTNY